MPRRPSRLTAGLTRRTLLLGASIGAATTSSASGAEVTSIGRLWLDWVSARAAVDMPADNADDAYAEVDGHLHQLTASLMQIPAVGVGDVAIKLLVLLGMAPIECGDSDEFPWSQIRIMLDDLERAANQSLMLPSAISC